MNGENKNILLEECMLDTPGFSLFYSRHVRKDSQPVVLVHGLGVSSRYMLPLARELAKTSSVYAIDLPGFGKSPKPKGKITLNTFAGALEIFLNELSIDKPVLIGNSFGCQVIIKLLKANPALASKAVLIGPTMNIYERKHLKQMERWLQNLKYEPTHKMAWILIKDIVQCGIFRVLRTLHVGIKDKPEEGIEKIDIPILFLRGSKDPISPQKWLELLAERNSKYAVGELPDAGHALNFNSPRPLAEIIRRFIDASIDK